MLAKNLAAAAGNAGEATYVDDVFSTYLTTGTGSATTVSNGIDLAGEGGLVWQKTRNNVGYNTLFDTERGINKGLYSNTTDAQATNSNWLTAFNSDGFTFGTTNNLSVSGWTGVSWTFRKAEKWFDIVTYTGNGVTNRQIAHNLGSTPGCIIVKCTSVATNWVVYHRNLTNANYCLLLNSTSAQVSDSTVFGTAPTDTVFTVARTGISSNTNQNGATYVAYLFAHDAGGFGADGSENVISCGSFVTDPTTGGATVNLGYEPQFLLVKSATSVQGWHLIDNMRGMANLGTYGDAAKVEPNTSSAESTGANCYPTSTGFWYARSGSTTYIYIAIRRPMKPPSAGTEVFSPIVSTASTGTALTTGFPVDMQFPIALAPTYTISNAVDRLRGVSSTTTASGKYLEQSNTNAEASGTVTRNWGNTGFEFPDYFATLKTLFLSFKRAPGFMDVVCYTGTGSTPLTVNHNLDVPPEIVLVKRRTGGTGGWYMYAAPWGNDGSGVLNSTSAFSTGQTHWNNTNPTSTYFQIGTTSTAFNGSGSTYVAYLFASLPGISKVGSYTGTGSTIQVDCGFTSGVRFLMIKRADSTGGWYVWDSARGIVPTSEPYLLLNSTAAEVYTDYIDPYSPGFQVSSLAPAELNASGGTYVFLAIS